MCLALVALGAHPRYPLVVVANRDEFHRPSRRTGAVVARGLATAAATFEAGGTWLGVARDGPLGAADQRPRTAAPRPGCAARAARWSRRSSPATTRPRRAVAATIAAAAKRNGFNLLAGDAGGSPGASNRAAFAADADAGRPRAVQRTRSIRPGPRSGAPPRRCGAGAPPARSTLDALLDLLADRAIAPDDELPSTGVPLEWERRLSAPFIVGDRLRHALLDDLRRRRRGQPAVRRALVRRRRQPRRRGQGSVSPSRSVSNGIQDRSRRIARCAIPASKNSSPKATKPCRA